MMIFTSLPLAIGLILVVAVVFVLSIRNELK